MRFKMLCAVSLVACLGIIPMRAGAWSEATHAYIADEIGYSYGLRNMNEIYGAMAPDMFNFEFSLMSDPAMRSCVQAHTHGVVNADPSLENIDFLKVWDNAGWLLDENAAFGYVCHNDVFGADFAAHTLGYTNAGDMGWVIEKTLQLKDMLAAADAWTDLGVDLNIPSHNAAATLVSHYMIEQAGDLIIKRADPAIGARVALAALFRTDQFEDTVAVAIECGDEAYVRDVENRFRERTFEYGLAFLGSEEAIISIMVQKLTETAPTYFAAYGVTIPESGLPLIPEISEMGITAALTMIETDYMDEIAAVIYGLEAAMDAYGVFY